MIKYLNLGLSPDELREILSKNQEALTFMRVGLQRESYTPSAGMDRLMDHLVAFLAPLKRLAQINRMEGRLAELEGRTNEAARVHLDNIRLGQESSRGGVIIEKLVGLAIEALGRESIRSLVVSLDAQKCRELIQTLETIEANKESAADVLVAEKAWLRRNYSTYQRTVSFLSEVIEQKSLNPNQSTHSSFKVSCETRDLETGKLLIQLAARAYELEKGQPPKSAGDLVPEYLKTVPKDPLTGTNLLIQP